MSIMLTKRQEIVLAALSAGSNGSFAPVQVQKMFFLLDESLSSEFGAKLFEFEPYDYGPFDKNVYIELNQLTAIGLVEVSSVNHTAGGRRYSVTASGRAFGERKLASVSPGARKFIADVADWVRRLSFAQLVGSIYKAFPHMRAKSIFVD